MQLNQNILCYFLEPVKCISVYFRLAYFERKHKFYSQAQLQAEAQTHYIGQFVKQLYVLVLGLDVLGNPFGLVTGLKQGVEDFFYEPFQVTILFHVILCYLPAVCQTFLCILLAQFSYSS